MIGKAHVSNVGTQGVGFIIISIFCDGGGGGGGMGGIVI